MPRGIGILPMIQSLNNFKSWHEMKLILFRHADAATDAATDFERPLSDKGVAQVERIARFCLTHDLVPAVILHSPLIRAKQTAEVFAEETKLTRLIETTWLSSGMEPRAALAELPAYAEFESVMLVGHEPDFSILAATLIGAPDPSRLRLRKASLTIFDLPDPATGEGALETLLPARYMKE